MPVRYYIVVNKEKNKPILEIICSSIKLNAGTELSSSVVVSEISHEHRKIAQLIMEKRNELN